MSEPAQVPTEAAPAAEEAVSAAEVRTKRILILGLVVTLMLKGRERVPKEGDRRKTLRRREDRMRAGDFKNIASG